MNAATRHALQKKKKALAQSRMTRGAVDLVEVRTATKNKLIELSEIPSGDKSSEPQNDSLSPTKLATQIENILHTDHHAPSPAYRNAFRRLYTSLKNEKAPFRTELRTGKLPVEKFAKMSADELKSTAQQAADHDLKEKGIKNSVGTQLLPENVNYIKDGRDREKWGVSRSAAAIDD